MQKNGLSIKMLEWGKEKEQFFTSVTIAADSSRSPEAMLKDAGIELVSQQISKFVRAVREEPQFKDAVVNNADVLNGSPRVRRRHRVGFHSSSSSAEALPLSQHCNCGDRLLNYGMGEG
jgi:hypothetical protein